MEIPLIQRVTAVLWPSFLYAGVATVLFFTVFDPRQQFIEFEISRLGAYSIGFFLFWALTVASSATTLYFLLRPRPEETRRSRATPADDSSAGDA